MIKMEYILYIDQSKKVVQEIMYIHVLYCTISSYLYFVKVNFGLLVLNLVYLKKLKNKVFITYMYLKPKHFSIISHNDMGCYMKWKEFFFKGIYTWNITNKLLHS